jgi:PAS domain S-box-containing protein
MLNRNEPSGIESRTLCRPMALGGKGDDPPEIDRAQPHQPPARGDGPPLGVLVVSAPERALIGSFFELGPAGLTLGRGPQATVCVQDMGISRLHLRIARCEDGTFRAEDLRSSNGTFVNAVRIGSVLLAEGDRIHLGSGTELLFGRRGECPGGEVRLRQAVATTGAGIWEWSSDGRLSLAGGLAREQAPCAERTEPAPDDLWSRVHEEDRAGLRALLDQVARSSERCAFECRLLRSDGTVTWLAMRGEVVRDGSGRCRGISGTAMDITARKRAEEELRRQSLLLDSLSDGVAAVDFEGNLLDWSARAEQIFGWSKAEVLGRRLSDVLSCGDDLGALVVARARAGLREPQERLLRRKVGGDIAVEVVALPLRDPEERQVACVAVLRDVDERRRILSQLQVAERLASLGTLATGIAHQINNPLAFISANLSWVRQQLAQVVGASAAGVETLDRALLDCEEGTQRIRAIVQDLRSHVSEAGGGPELGSADPNEAMEYALRIAGHELHGVARVSCNLLPVPMVNGSSARLGQVFLNLLLNAAQAVPLEQQGTAEIRVRSRLDTDSDMVVLEVEDTGAGIAPEALTHVFDPFFTTKPVGRGTGLGLFICHSIVSALGGTISADSRLGHGTTVRVALPRAKASGIGGQDDVTAARVATGKTEDCP